MYCPNCELRVETDRATATEQDDAERYRKWFDDEDVRGEYGIGDVGDEVRDGWTVALRVDICGNCAVPIDARTYTR